MSARPGDIVWVEPNHLQANSWNPNRMNAPMYAKELQSIKDHGFVDPVTAYDDGDYKYIIIDGEHRWRAAMDLGLKEIPVFLVDIDNENDAKKLTILLNELRGQALPEKMGDLLKDLMSSSSLEELLNELPYTEDMFRGFTELPPLTGLESAPPSVVPEQSEPERRWVERLLRLPMSAAAIYDQAVARVKAGEPGDMEDWQAIEYICADYLSK